MPLQRFLILVAFLIMSWQSLVPPNLVRADQDDVWHLSALAGKVKVRESWQQAPRPAKVGDLLGPGAAVETGPGGRAMVFLANGAVLKLGAESLLEFVKLTGNARPPSNKFTLTTGTLQFAVDFALDGSDSQIIISSATSRVVIHRGAGFLISAASDHLVFLEGTSISVVNQISQQRLVLEPRQAVISERDGRLKLSQISSGEVGQLLARTQVHLAMPPTQMIELSKPIKTPTTLADQVRKPWPVLPPVIQSPNIWIHEKSVQNGRAYRRPHPRR